MQTASRRGFAPNTFPFELLPGWYNLARMKRYLLLDAAAADILHGTQGQLAAVATVVP
jgi:hypothetical protein